MSASLRIGLIGDYDAAITAHQAIPLALKFAARDLAINARFAWVSTDSILSNADVSNFDGLWCVPGSPYRNASGMLLAIRHAREALKPLLGTCGGFQYALLEYAHNVLGWKDAEHGETSAGARLEVISPLACALVEATQTLSLSAGSRLATAYGALETTERYRCRYGINPRFQQALIVDPLVAVAHDENGDVRAVELTIHPFFVATLFQPERAALEGEPAPLVNAFVQACITR